MALMIKNIKKMAKREKPELVKITFKKDIGHYIKKGDTKEVTKEKADILKKKGFAENFGAKPKEAGKTTAKKSNNKKD